MKGTYGICTTAFDKLRVWGSLDKVNYDGNIFAVVPNSLNDELVYKRMKSLVSDFSREPINPQVGLAREPLSEEDKRTLLEGLVIKAPPDIQQKYVDLLIMYHDTSSKSKFDIGRTNVIDHKVVLNKKDTIHIRWQGLVLVYLQCTMLKRCDGLLERCSLDRTFWSGKWSS